jgi:hypothetical protein
MACTAICRIISFATGTEHISLLLGPSGSSAERAALSRTSSNRPTKEPDERDGADPSDRTVLALRPADHGTGGGGRSPRPGPRGQAATLSSQWGFTPPLRARPCTSPSPSRPTLPRAARGGSYVGTVSRDPPPRNAGNRSRKLLASALDLAANSRRNRSRLSGGSQPFLSTTESGSPPAGSVLSPTARRHRWPAPP